MKFVDACGLEIEVGDLVLVRTNCLIERYATVAPVLEGDFWDAYTGEQRNGVYLKDNEGTCIGLDSALKDKFTVVTKIVWD